MAGAGRIGNRTQAAFLALMLAQAAHSVEEFVFRLYDVLAPARFLSELLGFDRPLGFVLFNMILILFGLWCWVARVGPGRPSGRALAWIWSALEFANGCAHLVLAFLANGYFPGLATAPLLLAAAIWLARELRRARH